MTTIHISSNEMQVVKAICRALPYQVIVFGSRVTGKHSQFSDLDLCLKGTEKLSILDIERLKQQFSDSDLPYMVDIVDYHSASRPFQQIIDKQGADLFDDPDSRSI